MSQKPRLFANNPIVHSNGTMQEEFRRHMAELGYAIPLRGAGSPEGVVEALQYSTYINNTGSTGTLMYVKKLTDIGGDTTQGWVAV